MKCAPSIRRLSPSHMHVSNAGHNSSQTNNSTQVSQQLVKSQLNKIKMFLLPNTVHRGERHIFFRWLNKIPSLSLFWLLVCFVFFYLKFIEMQTNEKWNKIGFMCVFRSFVRSFASAHSSVFMHLLVRLLSLYTVRVRAIVKNTKSLSHAHKYISIFACIFIYMTKKLLSPETLRISFYVCCSWIVAFSLFVLRVFLPCISIKTETKYHNIFFLWCWNHYNVFN